MSISKIEMENFTVFDNISVDFCSGINVFIGENGTGKTHLLKCLYAFCECEMINGKPDFGMSYIEKLRGCFQNTPIEFLSHNFADVLRNDPPIAIEIYENGTVEPMSMRLTGSLTKFTGTSMIYSEKDKIKTQSVFIPAKEMLTHSRLEKDFAQRNLPFDITLIDVLNKSGVSTVRNLSGEMESALSGIATIIGGTVVFDDDQYYIKKDNGALINFAVEAEGFKKLGLIYRLIETGNIENGSVLFWDEPEANINPKNIPAVVDLLLILQDVGVQVFVATHDYVFAKYLEIKRKAVRDVKFYSFYKAEHGVDVENNDNFEDLQNNSIEEAYNTLVDEVYR